MMMPTGASFIARSLSRRSSTVSASFRSRAASRREVCRRSTRFPIRVRSARFRTGSSTTSSAWSHRGLRRRRRRVVAREQHEREEGGRRALPPRLDRSGDPVELAGAEDAAVERRFERSRVRRHLDAEPVADGFGHQLAIATRPHEKQNAGLVVRVGRSSGREVVVGPLGV